EFERLAHRIGLHRDVALRIDELRAEAMEERACRIDVVGGLAETNTECVAPLLAGFRRLEERLIGPAVRLGRGTGGIERLHVDAGMLLHQVNARAWAL